MFKKFKKILAASILWVIGLFVATLLVVAFIIAFGLKFSIVAMAVIVLILWSIYELDKHE